MTCDPCNYSTVYTHVNYQFPFFHFFLQTYFLLHFPHHSSASQWPSDQKKIPLDSEPEADLRSALTIASQQKRCAFWEWNRLPELSWSWTLTAGPFSSQQVDILYWKASSVLAGQTQRAAPKHALVLAKLLSVFLTGRLFSIVASSTPLSSPKTAHPQHLLYGAATIL